MIKAIPSTLAPQTQTQSPQTSITESKTTWFEWFIYFVNNLIGPTVCMWFFCHGGCEDFDTILQTGHQRWN